MFNGKGNSRLVPDQTSNAYTHRDDEYWLLVWRMSEARRIAASGVSAVMSVGKMMSPRLPNILQRKSGMVRSFAPFRREHTYLSATGAPRDGPLPAMKSNVYPWDQRRKLMSKKSWNLRAHAAYQEPRGRQVKADNAVLISPRSSSFGLGWGGICDRR